MIYAKLVILLVLAVVSQAFQGALNVRSSGLRMALKDYKEGE